MMPECMAQVSWHRSIPPTEYGYSCWKADAL